MGKFINGQPALPRISSRQWRSVATCWNAGAHIVVFESPTRATVAVEAVSPVAHSGCPISKNWLRQPLSNIAGFSAAASASGGSRFDGYPASRLRPSPPKPAAENTRTSPHCSAPPSAARSS